MHVGTYLSSLVHSYDWMVILNFVWVVHVYVAYASWII